MNDRNKIVIALIAFVVLITFPFWINFGKKVSLPKLELTERAKNVGKCILPTEEMVSGHMQLLDLWRHSVVRNAKRNFINSNGLEYKMSLSSTCLDCHSNKDKFCDKCHDYASVKPYCWDCHIDDLGGNENE